MPHLPPPGLELVRAVRAGFTAKGTTMGRWCRENGLHDQNARAALLGGWNGPKGRALRERLIAAAGLNEPEIAKAFGKASRRAAA